MNCQKDKFSIDEGITYLNGAYMSPQLKEAEQIGIQAVKRKSKPWMITPNDFFSESGELRKLFARLINCGEPDRIALIPSVSYGIATVARNIKFSKGDSIVLLDKIFPSNYYVWKNIANAHEVDLQLIKAPETVYQRGQAWNQLVMDAIKPGTKVISLEHIHWADGTLFDLVSIRKKANEVGALVIVDGTQSIGAYPFDLELLQVDALIAGGYKSLLGPYSLGYAYYGKAFDQGEPLEHNWMNKMGAEVFEKLLDYTEEDKPFAAKYNMGEQSQFVNVPMAKVALQQLLEWGVNNIQSYCKNMVDEILPLLKEKNIWIETEAYRANHLFGLKPYTPLDRSFKQKLSDHKVYVSFRGESIRVAPYVHNTSKDLELLIHLI